MNPTVGHYYITDVSEREGGEGGSYYNTSS